jgi:Mg2+ and Co2+ transporter CorA
MLGTESLSSTKLPENVEIMVLDASNNLREDVGLEELPDCLSDKNTLVWCDISATDRKGGPYWRLMTETFGFDQLTIEDCFSQSRLPLLNDYGSYLFMVLFSFGLPETGEKTPRRTCGASSNIAATVYRFNRYDRCCNSASKKDQRTVQG